MSDLIKIESVEQSINENMKPVLNICIEFDIETYQELQVDLGEVGAREVFTDLLFKEITKDN